MFAAHGIAAVVGAENHAGMLGGLGGGFLSLDIWVDGEDQDEAVALLRDFRERDDGQTDEDEDDDDAFDGEGDAAFDAAARDAADAAGDAAGTFGSGSERSPDRADSVQLRIERRRRTGVVLLLGCFLTFGTAHMFTRAWARGIALAGLEILGFMYIGDRGNVGGLLVAGAILGDLIGALWRVRTAPGSVLPEARVRGS
jgi:hypothetical protein